MTASSLYPLGLIDALERLKGRRLRITVSGVAKIGVLAQVPGAGASWTLDGRVLAPLSRVTMIEQRWMRSGRPVYETDWSA